MKLYIEWNPACYNYSTDSLRKILGNIMRNYDRLREEEIELVRRANDLMEKDEITMEIPSLLKAAKIRRNKAENLWRLSEDVANELSIRED